VEGESVRTASYIDEATTERIRARAISYVHSDIEPGLSLRQYRRRAGGAGLGRSVQRAARVIARMAARYADDPVGDYETTDGAW
jgi:hypothetical protein